jgi:DNA-binding Lrp family transcriptional regulator
MNRFHRDTIKERLLRLAAMKCTGTPTELASRFEIGERSVKRIVKEIRESGIEIRYSRLLGTYVID